MFQLGGIIVTLVNGVVVLILRRRLRGAFTRRGRLIDGACIAGFLLLAHPGLFMAVASWSGMRALQRHLPETLSMIAMGAQVGLLFYAVLLGAAAVAGAVFRALRAGQPATSARAAKAPDALKAHPDAADTTRQAAVDEPRSGVVTPSQPVDAIRPEAVDEGRRRVVTAAAWALPSAAIAVSMGEGLQRALGQMRDDGAPRVLLSHHPRTFVEARDLPFDLMLSGHTHGGLISLGRVGDRALTPLLPIERYHNGLYEHRGRRLHVNAGAGGWLPVRINCPPEITLVELVPA